MAKHFQSDYLHREQGRFMNYSSVGHHQSLDGTPSFVAASAFRSRPADLSTPMVAGSARSSREVMSRAQYGYNPGSRNDFPEPTYASQEQFRGLAQPPVQNSAGRLFDFQGEHFSTERKYTESRSPETLRDAQWRSENGASYSSASSASQGMSHTNIYISGLMADTSDDDLLILCAPYGSIVSTKAIRDRDLNACKGYGFIMFEHESAATRAIDGLNKGGFQATFAKMSRSQTEFPRTDVDLTNLYFTNLPLDLTETQLVSMLSHNAGAESSSHVLSCRILVILFL